MDKYEYRLKTDHIKQVVARGDYETAAGLCDSIDWNKVRDVKMLTTVADTYAAVKRYQEAIDALVQAYKFAPLGRRIVYRLTELALLADNYEEAKEYFDEFCRVAPHDQGRYILLYQMACSQRATVAEKIKILEAYKREDFDERWAYELAALYVRSSQIDKCVQLCDDIILWFGLGKYVEKALALKAMYAPLTAEQEERAREIRELKAAGRLEESRNRIDHTLSESEEESGELQGDTRVSLEDAPNEMIREIQGVPENVRELQVDSELDAVGKVTAANVRSIEEAAAEEERRRVEQAREVARQAEDLVRKKNAEARKDSLPVQDSSRRLSQLVADHKRSVEEAATADYSGEMNQRIQEMVQQFHTETNVLQYQAEQKAAVSEEKTEKQPEKAVVEVVVEEPENLPEETKKWVPGRKKPLTDSDTSEKDQQTVSREKTKTDIWSSEGGSDGIAYAQEIAVEQAGEDQPTENQSDLLYEGSEIGEVYEYTGPEEIAISADEYTDGQDESSEQSEREEDGVKIPIVEEVNLTMDVSEIVEMETMDIPPIEMTEEDVYEYEDAVELQDTVKDPVTDRPGPDYEYEDDSESDDESDDEYEADDSEYDDEYDEEYDAEYDDSEYDEEYDAEYDDSEYDEEYDDEYDEEYDAEYDDAEYDEEYDAEYDDSEYDEEYDAEYDDAEYDEEYDAEYDDEYDAEYDAGDDDAGEYEADEDSEYEEYDEEPGYEDNSEHDDAEYEEDGDSEYEADDNTEYEADNTEPDAKEEHAARPSGRANGPQMNPGNLSEVWHFAVNVPEGEVPMQTALGFIRMVGGQSKRPIPKRIARVTGSQLNSKDLVQSLDRLLDKLIVVINAGEMEDRVVNEICKLLEPSDRSMMMVLVDNRARLAKMFDAHPQLSEIFTAQFMQAHYTAGELLKYAKEYADGQDSVMDQGAELYLMEMIERVLNNGQERNKKKTVENLINHAIEEAEKKSLKRSFSTLFSVRYDKEGRLILTKKHFGFIE